ncbi:hypothetical protein AVEN_224888-1 [Araneus ventricosus]|uniref:Uncharacterized protein n=1 Tax=Araneus ventricosus TaxID=182803 RepID=A0A4Y2PRV3_ARAVE|nr:hypothetical protein AVEN_224888-1 [Araneus ventricosus]
MTQHSKWITNGDENPNFSTIARKFPTEFRIDDRFWKDATEIAWRCLTVNVQLKAEPRLNKQQKPAEYCGPMWGFNKFEFRIQSRRT